LAPGCSEQLPDWGFLREAWAFAERELPAALAVLGGPEAVRPDGARARVVMLRSAREAVRFVADARRSVMPRPKSHRARPPNPRAAADEGALRS
jgi:hypothetical protein